MIYTSYDVTTANKLFKNIIRSIFDSTDREDIVEYPNVMRDIPVTDYYEDELQITGLPHAALKNEGSPIVLNDVPDPVEKRFTQAAYANGYRASMEWKKFNRIKHIDRLTRSLKKSMVEYKDVVVSTIYTNPAAGLTGFDDSYLIVTDHAPTYLASDTWSNKTTSALSMSTLESAYIYFDTLKDDQGNIYFAKPKKLVVPPQLQMTAQKLLYSTLVPFEVSNTKNLAPRWGVVPYVYHRLSEVAASQNDWFVIGDVGDADFGPRVYSSMVPDLDVHDAYDDSRDTIVTSVEMFTYGFTDSRLCYGGIVA